MDRMYSRTGHIIYFQQPLAHKKIHRPTWRQRKQYKHPHLYSFLLLFKISGFFPVVLVFRFPILCGSRSLLGPHCLPPQPPSPRPSFCQYRAPVPLHAPTDPNGRSRRPKDALPLRLLSLQALPSEPLPGSGGRLLYKVGDPPLSCSFFPGFF